MSLKRVFPVLLVLLLATLMVVLRQPRAWAPITH